MTTENSKTVTHTETFKIIERKEPLKKIIPPMILEIIEEQVQKYAKENNISKYTINLGDMQQTITIRVDENTSELSGRDELMTSQAKIIEAYLFDYYKVNKNVYLKTRGRDLLKYRQKIQFFMAFYADMTLANVGFITGHKDHATVMHSKKKILLRLDKSKVSNFKKEMFLVDRAIANILGVESKIFNIYGELLDTVKNHSK
jgi:chromosomal replication initiation ATPase DnaA